MKFSLDVLELNLQIYILTLMSSNVILCVLLHKPLCVKKDFTNRNLKVLLLK